MSDIFIKHKFVDITPENPEIGAIYFERNTGLIKAIESANSQIIVGTDYNNLWYGVEKDMSVGDLACTRIGNMGLHRTLPIHSRQKGCLIADDGSIVKYLNPDTWEDEIRDGSQGQVMVEIPDHYRYVNLDENNKLTVKLSEYPLPGFTYYPKRYVSAYEATVQRSTNKLSSVVNLDVDYRGGNNNDAWDGTYRSLLGKPATSINKTNFRTYARNRGEKWNIWTYAAYREMYWLFIVEYATLNSQAGFNAELTSEGFKQGGLGQGVTTWSSESWNNYNIYYPFIPCGASDSLGNYSGEVSYTIKDTDGVSDLKSFMIPRYRGVENPFGHIWKWVDGYNMYIDTDNTRKVYITDNPVFFVDGTSEGLIYIGNEPTTAGYLKEMNIDSYGNFCPKTVGASSTTYFSDYFYSPVSVGASGWRALLLGGCAYSGGAAGLSYFDSASSASRVYAYIGARLCFVP